MEEEVKKGYANHLIQKLTENIEKCNWKRKKDERSVFVLMFESAYIQITEIEISVTSIKGNEELLNYKKMSEINEGLKMPEFISLSILYDKVCNQIEKKSKLLIDKMIQEIDNLK